jgi:hypothetical protein
VRSLLAARTEAPSPTPAAPPRAPRAGASARRGAALALLAGALAAASCAPSRHPGDWVALREVTPAFLVSLGASDPALATDRRGRVALTYVTRDSTGRNAWLALSRDSGVTFSVPVRINARTGSVVSFPESRPLPAFGTSGEFAVIWTERSSDSARAADVVVRASGDAGVTLGPPAVVNDDDRLRAQHVHDWPWLWHHPWTSNAWHAFPALTFLPDGSVFAAWLDERENPIGPGEPSTSSLYAAQSTDGGLHWGENQRIAASVCPCCRPVALADAEGRVAVAYRRGAADLRDPALAVSSDFGRTFALDTLISADRWLLKACPDQGAALTWNRGRGGHYAWYTGAEPAGVYLMPWHDDHGAAGVRRALADSLHDAESPRLAPLGESTLIGLEARPAADTTRHVFAVRTLDPGGSLTPWCFLGADASEGWLAGLDAHSAIACWVERDGESHRVRIARLHVR